MARITHRLLWWEVVTLFAADAVAVAVILAVRRLLTRQ
jgi:hypothetical protein